MATGLARNNRFLRGGLDLGGTKIQAVVLSRTHRVIGEARRPTPLEGGPEAVTAAMAETIGEAASTAGVAPRYLAGVGVGSPGSIDAVAGTVSQAGNLPGWDGSFPLGERLSGLLGCAAPIRRYCDFRSSSTPLITTSPSSMMQTRSHICSTSAN